MTPDPSADHDVDYELTRFFRRVRDQAMSRLHEINDELDYNTFLLFIGIADADGGVRASVLAEGMRVHKSTVSRGVATLERIGLIERAQHPDDGRAQLLSVPRDARKLLDAYRQRNFVWFAQLRSDWTETDVQTFADQLARLNNAAERMTRS